MKIGIGLPATIPGASPSLVLDWARKAEAGPFSSLTTLDRLVYPNYESLITLAVAAGATRRIRLMTTILLAPLRPTAILAKEAATLDALSNGRFTLGLGIGGREDDFHAVAAAFNKRGRAFEKQLETMKRIWSGERLAEHIGPIGPAPITQGGPELLIGGYSPAALNRVAHWADGYVSGGQANPTRLAETYATIEKDWNERGRPGKPRHVGAVYCALGPEAADKSAPYIRSYYAFMGPRVQDMITRLPTTAETLKNLIHTFADIGMDELILWPCVAELDQVDRFAELVG
jgi:alkanesulfonate monooxygenase SsuD/methylene tetrahydromethanopterin reductase-like flavin-dependent oxidoreductase (luciferase family)